MVFTRISDESWYCPLLPLPSCGLRNDPVWVCTSACRSENLSEGLELAIPHTFENDVVRDIPRAHLQTMMVEP